MNYKDILKSTDIERFLKKHIAELKIACMILVMLVLGIVYMANSKGGAGKQSEKDTFDAADVSSTANMVQGSAGQNAAAGQTASTGQNVSTGQTVAAGQNVAESVANSTEAKILVYLCGYVENPGVYEIKSSARLYELVDEAGGFLEDADLNELNLAEGMSDGEKIYVPCRGENAIITGGESNSISALVNINKATKEQLTGLPGIGEARAADIIAYRESNGSFKSKEDIMNVSGIKEAAYSKLKDYICV